MKFGLLSKVYREILRHFSSGGVDHPPFVPETSGNHLAQRLRIPGVETITDLANYFGNREQPILFHTPQSMSNLLTAYKVRHCDWYQRLIDKVSDEHNRGIFLYSARFSPLGTDFDWTVTGDWPGNDKLYRKRIHRFFFLPRLALAAALNSEAGNWLRDTLESWLQFVKTDPSNLAYDSNLAVIQRIFAVSWALLYLYGAQPAYRGKNQTCIERLLIILINDIHFLAPALGQSYGNNHLLADFFAGWYIQRCFPELVTTIWQARDFDAMWTDELLRQTYDDGWTFEHSSHYHEFACDMGIAYLLLSKANNWSYSDCAAKRIEKMLYLQSALAGDSQSGIAIGDTVEDNFFPLGVHEGLGPTLYQRTYKALFNPEYPECDPTVPASEVAYWLLGTGYERQDSPQNHSRLSGLYAFEQGGLYLHKDEKLGTEFLFRTGATSGVEVSAGHSHTDQLTVCLSVAGRPLIVPSGTYTYRSAKLGWPENNPAWRAYFLGRQSANGVYLPGVDFWGECEEKDFRARDSKGRVVTSVMTSPFMSYIRGEIVNIIQAVGVQRSVAILNGEYLLIYDDTPITANHSDTRFQCAPDVVVSQQDVRSLCLTNNELEVSMYASNDLQGPTIVLGSQDPIGGWVSKQYGERQPAPQIIYKPEPKSFRTAYCLKPGREELHFNVSQDYDTARFEITGGDWKDTLIVSCNGQCKSLLHGNTQVNATLAWYREVKGSLTSLKTLLTNSVSFEDGSELVCSKTESWLTVDFNSCEKKISTSSGLFPDTYSR